MNQNNFKHLFLLFYFLLFLCPSILSAQQSKITVTSFNRMENDITARITAPKRDQNGEICALIRIVTNEKDLMFEPDALGITARENKTGEVWVYVPRGARRISILHDKLGILRNYFYPDIIEKATVYEMVLNTSDDQNKPVAESNMQFLVVRPELPQPMFTLTKNRYLWKTDFSTQPCRKENTPIGWKHRCISPMPVSSS